MGTEHMAEESYEIEEEWIKGSSLCHPNDTEIEVVCSLFDGKPAKKIAHKNAV
jgi:hypothetical protein